MLRPSLARALIVLIPLGMCAMSLFLGAGCRDKPPEPEVKKTEIAPDAKKEEKKPDAPFPDAVGKTLGGIADATKGDLSALSLEKLGKLHISGLSLLLLAIAARFLFGSWKHSFIIVSLGLGLSAGAVLLTDHPRVVFLIPLGWLAFLMVELIRKALGWRSKAKGFDAVANVIETDDTGPQSTGQRIKNKFKEAGVAGIIDIALKPLEKEWEQQKTKTSPAETGPGSAK